jgi:FtsX-like permease family
MRIWAGGQWFYVTGILNPDTYAPELDSAVLVGFPAARKYLHFDGHPAEIYVRTVNTQAVTTRVDGLLGYQANPENPSQVTVSQPSDALTAQADAKGALDTLFLGLGAVALLVGAIGVANIMVISVLERRSEIGLRRALGATRGQIRAQFLAEAILLSLAGGVIGVFAGATATAAYAHAKGWAIVIPPDAWTGGLAAAVIIGAAAGLLPAIRAARLSPLRRSGASDKTGTRQDRQRVPWRGFRCGSHGHLHRGMAASPDIGPSVAAVRSPCAGSGWCPRRSWAIRELRAAGGSSCRNETCIPRSRPRRRSPGRRDGAPG